MRRFIPAVLIVFIIVVTAGCAARTSGKAAEEGKQAVRDIDYGKKLGPYSYGEKAGKMKAAVGTEITYHRSSPKYLPLQIKIANDTGKSLEFTLENFTLVSPPGKEFKALTSKDLTGHGNVDFELRISEGTRLAEELLSKDREKVQWPSYTGTGNEVLALNPGEAVTGVLYFRMDDEEDLMPGGYTLRIGGKKPLEISFPLDR